MPTYQYSCTECEHFFEQFQSFAEDSLTVCPECQGRLRKVFNAVGVVFKGSGFYRTDSRSAVTSADAPSSGTPAAKASTEGSKDSSKPSTASQSTSSGSAGSGATPATAGSAA